MPDAAMEYERSDEDESPDEDGDEDEGDDESPELEGIYLVTPYFGAWIDNDKELATRWQMECKFVEQLREDEFLQHVFWVVINKEEKSIDELSFRSGLLQIHRAFDNRFDMAGLLARQAMQTPGMAEEDLDDVQTEIRRLHCMTLQFQNEEGAFHSMSDKLKKRMMDFAKWRAGLKSSPVQGGPTTAATATAMATMATSPSPEKKAPAAVTGSAASGLQDLEMTPTREGLEIVSEKEEQPPAAKKSKSDNE